jgi:hypothetical protein
MSVPEWNYTRNQEYQSQYKNEVKEGIFYLIRVWGIRGGISRRRLADQYFSILFACIIDVTVVINCYYVNSVKVVNNVKYT